MTKSKNNKPATKEPTIKSEVVASNEPVKVEKPANENANPDVNIPKKQSVEEALKLIEMEKAVLAKGKPDQLTVTDLKIMIGVIDVTIKNGVFPPEDVGVIGSLYNKVVAIANYQTALANQTARDAKINPTTPKETK